MTEQPYLFDRYFIQIKKIWEKPTIKKFSKTTATLLLIIFFLVVALKPTVETIFTLNKKISDFRAIEQEMTTKITNINQAMNTYQQIQSQIPLITEYYPNLPQSEKLVALLNSNSSDLSSKDTTFSFSEYKIVNGSGKLTATYNGGNSYPNVITLLTNLINTRRLLNISEVSMRENSTDKNVSFSVSLNLFYAKE